MWIKSLLLVALLGFAFLPSSAKALSCVKPSGDQVLRVLSHNKNLPVWIGEVRVLSVDENSNISKPMAATFELVNIYTNTHGVEMPDEINVSISSLHRSWGMWGDDRKTKDLIESGDAIKVILRKAPELGWDFIGPGACTYFSVDEWESLSKGHYDHAEDLKYLDTNETLQTEGSLDAD